MYRSYPKQPVYAVSTTNMPFEAVNLLPVKQEKILAFSSLLKITIVYFSSWSFNGKSLDWWPPATRTRWSPTGGGKRGTDCTETRRSTSPHDKPRRRYRETEVPPREEVTRSVCVLQFENGLFFNQQKFKAEQSFSVGLSVDWAIDREARELSGAIEAKRQSWGRARMPEQRQAGQLVFYKIPLLHETLTGEALTHVEQHKKKLKINLLKSELVSKTFIFLHFGPGPSNQLNSATGLTLCHVATMTCRSTAEKPHSN